MTFSFPRIVGHRGAAKVAPENTLAGLAAARGVGARAVEFDAKLTRDEVPILFHDDTLERTTDGSGAVARATYEEILALDAGSWFSGSHRGERVVTLEVALRVCQSLGLQVNLELKPCPGREVRTAEVALEVARRVLTAPPWPLVSSFDDTCLEVASSVAPTWPRGLLVDGWPGIEAVRARAERYACASVHVDARCLGAHPAVGGEGASTAGGGGEGEVPEGGLPVYEALRGLGLPILAYTVNDPDWAKALFELGVFGLFTDDPARLLPCVWGPDDA